VIFFVSFFYFFASNRPLECLWCFEVVHFEIRSGACQSSRFEQIVVRGSADGDDGHWIGKHD